MEAESRVDELAGDHAGIVDDGFLLREDEPRERAGHADPLEFGESPAGRVVREKREPTFGGERDGIALPPLRGWAGDAERRHPTKVCPLDPRSPSDALDRSGSLANGLAMQHRP